MLLKVEKDPSPWGHSDFKPVDDNKAKSTSSYNWGEDVNSDDFFSTLISDSSSKVSLDKKITNKNYNIK